MYVSVIHGHDQGSLLSRTMDRAMPPSVRVLYAEHPANRFSTGALEAVLDLWANKTIVACLLLIPEPAGLLPALTATNYRVPILWLPSVQRVDQVSSSVAYFFIYGFIYQLIFLIEPRLRCKSTNGEKIRRPRILRLIAYNYRFRLIFSRLAK